MTIRVFFLLTLFSLSLKGMSQSRNEIRTSHKEVLNDPARYLPNDLSNTVLLVLHNSRKEELLKTVRAKYESLSESGVDTLGISKERREEIMSYIMTVKDSVKHDRYLNRYFRKYYPYEWKIVSSNELNSYSTSVYRYILIKYYSSTMKSTDDVGWIVFIDYQIYDRSTGRKYSPFYLVQFREYLKTLEK